MEKKQSKQFKQSLARENNKQLKQMSKKKATSRSSSDRKNPARERSSLDKIEDKVKIYRNKKRRNKIRIAVLSILAVIVLVGGAGATLYIQKMGKMDRTVHFDEEDIIINEEVRQASIDSAMNHYRNIALFGVDSRNLDISAGSQSDTMIIASINEDTKEIKLVSILRDAFLNNTKGDFDKVTNIFNALGPKGAIDMLNKNLDLDITDYVAVNFKAVVDVVDALGGLDMHIRDDEYYFLSDYAYCNAEILGYEQPERLESGGDYHLNGLQVLGYCRIRYTNGLDMERAQRQRHVLNLILQKAKSSSLLTLNNVVDAALPNIATSLDNVEILELAMDVGAYSLVGSCGFPFNYSFENEIRNIDDCIVPISLTNDVRMLHSYLFGDDGYNPSIIVRNLDEQIYTDLELTGEIRNDSSAFVTYNQDSLEGVTSIDFSEMAAKMNEEAAATAQDTTAASDMNSTADPGVEQPVIS